MHPGKSKYIMMMGEDFLKLDPNIITSKVSFLLKF